ncbi:type II toxin-antitoxin system RelB/DinJ family antitoxin [Bartonella vinsonii]|uniref:type II toxin-antitoxin system RelB/DinJ family antitoxin n=1 Tax=Bartonella vinsonii TaxID=33047 RepID=UPI0002B6D061|nr:type II toxin-antitoxin system RelB/DinJ family antitoxin [Bartonella vinsonii]AGF75762.1 DNA-damage-inducible protein J [Bartonella vinsonii subsp. berkhoffii str. Winnie]
MGKIQARIPDEVQETASAVIKSTGLTVSHAVRMFMTRIARDRALPLDLFQPNPETLQAMVTPFVLVGKMLKIILFISKQKRANLKQMFFFPFYPN